MYEISLRIHEENELYNSFDESCRTLSGDVSDYLTRQYGRKEIGDDILLRIKCDRPIDADRVKTAFRETIREQELHIAGEKRLNLVKQIWLLCVGVVFVTAAILLNGIIGSVPVELISIVGSFAVWEAADIWIVENPRNRLAKRTLKKLNSTKIVIEDLSEGRTDKND